MKFPRFLLSLLLLLPLLGASPSGAQSLATPEQLSHERDVLRVLATPAMRAATARVEAIYRADPQARTIAGKARLRRAASSIATAAANYALSEDTSRTAVVWWVNAPHRWHGLTLPGSGFGIDNPDNVYQGFTVEGGKRYVIHGRMPSPAPVQLHLEVRDSIPGMGEMLVEGGQLLATIQSENLKIGANGAFDITVDSDAGNGRSNHLAIPSSGTFLVNVRQLFTDWRNQRPFSLRIERLDQFGPPPPRNIRRLALRGAEILDRIAPYWLAYDNRYLFTKPVNQIANPRLRPGGRGLTTSGHYALAPDEALVITVDALGAASLGVQITDPWGVAYDYDHRTSSLNNVQAQRDTGGTYTFIVSARDPGYANWLDSGGFSSGMVILRWQALSAEVNPANAVRTVSKVKLADVATIIPAGQARMTTAQRKTQRQQRAVDYAVRLAE